MSMTFYFCCIVLFLFFAFSLNLLDEIFNTAIKLSHAFCSFTVKWVQESYYVL